MSYLPYTLFKYNDGTTKYRDIMSTGSYRELKNEHCKTVKCGSYSELLAYCAQNHLELGTI